MRAFWLFPVAVDAWWMDASVALQVQVFAEIQEGPRGHIPRAAARSIAS